MSIERFRQFGTENAAAMLADIEISGLDGADHLNYKRAERLERLRQLDQGDRFHLATEYYFATHNDPTIVEHLPAKSEWIKALTPTNYAQTGIYAYHIYFTHLRALKLMHPIAADTHIRKLLAETDWEGEIESWRIYTHNLGTGERNHFYHQNIYTQALTGLAECLPEVYTKYIRQGDWDIIRVGTPLLDHEGFNQGSGALRIFSPELYDALDISDTELEQTREWLFDDEALQRRYFEEALYYYNVKKLPEIGYEPGKGLPVLPHPIRSAVSDLPTRLKFDQ